MESRAKYILSQKNNLTAEEKTWVIPKKNYETLENCSLELERLFEHRYERLIINREKIVSFLKEDAYFIEAFRDETDFLHTSLWVIDHFHCGVAGFDHIFWNMAGMYLIHGVDSCRVEHFFDPYTNEFDPFLDPLPPELFHHLDTAGNLQSSRDSFDRSDPVSAQWNFYNGVRSPRAEQRERFQILYNQLEYSDFEFDIDEDDPDLINVSYEIRNWDDIENDVLFANLEQIKSPAGRPKDSANNDQFSLMYAKTFMTRYFGEVAGKVPSRRSCIKKVADFLDIPEHNREAFHKRIDRKLKRKMTMRNLGQ